LQTNAAQDFLFGRLKSDPERKVIITLARMCAKRKRFLTQKEIQKSASVPTSVVKTVLLDSLSAGFLEKRKLEGGRGFALKTKYVPELLECANDNFLFCYRYIEQKA